MYRKITEDTQVKDLLALEADGKSAKPFLCELAQVVFRKESGGKLVNRRILHAFGQFSSEQLARIIEAKRNGIFDYGEFIIEVPGGFRYPKPADALIMLEDAENQGLGPQPSKSTDNEPSPLTQTGDSMDYTERKAELAAMAKRPLQQLHLQVTGNRSKRGEDRAALEERILSIEFSDTEDQENTFDPRPAGPTVIVNTVSTDAESTVDAVLDAPTIEAAVEAVETAQVVSLAQVARERAEAAPTEYTEEVDSIQLDRVEYALNDQVGRLIAGLRGVFVLVDIIRRNQDVLANALARIKVDDNGAKVTVLDNGVQNRGWSRVPDGIVQDFDTLVETSPSSTEEIVEEEAIHEVVVEEAQPVEEEEAPSNGSPDGVEVLSEDQLRELSHEALQKYAESVGVEDPYAQAFSPLLRRHVLKKLEQITA